MLKSARHSPNARHVVTAQEIPTASQAGPATHCPQGNSGLPWANPACLLKAPPALRPPVPHRFRGDSFSAKRNRCLWLPQQTWARPGELNWGWVLINGAFSQLLTIRLPPHKCAASGSQRRTLLTVNFSGFYIILNICILCIFTSLFPSYKHLIKEASSCWQVEELEAEGLAPC